MSNENSNRNGNGNGKIIVTGCGGAGSKLAFKIGQDVPNTEIHYIDTSKANLVDISDDNNVNFHQVKSSIIGDGEIDGSGGDVFTNIKHIVPSVKEYLEKNNIKGQVLGTYHLVVFAGSGGSGAGIGPKLIELLLSKDIPTIAMVIGDDTSLLTCNNTLQTITRLSKIATNKNKSLITIYVNNNTFTPVIDNNRIKSVNEYLVKTTSHLAKFLTEHNRDIDHQDMLNFIDPSNYSKIEVKTGLYGILITNKIDTEKMKGIPVLGRTLTTPSIDGNIGLKDLLHHKIGIMNDVTIVDTDTGTKQLIPLHMLTVSGIFHNMAMKLKDRATTINDIYRASETENLDEFIDKDDEF